MILTRRNFLRSILPAAVGAPVLLEELLHPGRVFFLPPRNITIYGDLSGFPIEEIIKKALARDMAKFMDNLVFATFSQGSGSTLPPLPRQEMWDVAA